MLSATSMSQRPTYYTTASVYSGANDMYNSVERGTMRSASMSQFNASSYGQSSASGNASSSRAGVKPLSSVYYSSSSRPSGGVYASSYYSSLYDNATTYRSPYTSATRRTDYGSSASDSYRSKPPLPSASTSSYGDANPLAAPGRYVRSSLVSYNSNSSAGNYSHTPSSGYSSASSTSSTRSNTLSRSASVDRYGLAGGAGGAHTQHDDTTYSRYESRRSRTLLNAVNDSPQQQHDTPDSLTGPLDRLLSSTDDYYSSYGTSRRNYRRPSATLTDSTTTGSTTDTSCDVQQPPLTVKVNDEECRNAARPPPSPSPSMGSMANGRKSPGTKKVTFNESNRPGPMKEPTRLKASPTGSILRASPNAAAALPPKPTPPVNEESQTVAKKDSPVVTKVEENLLTVPEAITPVVNGNSACTSRAAPPATATLNGGLNLKSASVQPVCNGDTAVHANGGSRAKTGIIGLTNIGNTCFMNCILQCLSHTRQLRDFCLDPSHVDGALNTTTSRMKGALMKAFIELLNALWAETSSASGRSASHTPDAFKSSVQKFAPRFSGYSQQDAQEFLRYVLQGLHEDVNRVRTKPKPDHSEIDSCLSDHMKASICWKRYLKFDDSKIVDVFVGQLKSELRCTVCGHVSSTFDPFWDLSLPVPHDKASSSRGGTPVAIADCFQALTGEEVLDGDEQPTCERCKTHRKCTKRFIINKFPPYLVLHLKRFSGERYRSRLSTLVQFPLQNLDLSQFTASGGTRCVFSLYGVANHLGTPLMGHYTAYVKHALTQQWYHFDDSRVSPITDPERTVVTSDAYVLFYELQNEVSRL